MDFGCVRSGSGTGEQVARNLLIYSTFPHQAKGHPIGCPFCFAWWGKEGGFGSPCPSCNGAKTVRWTVFRAWTSAVFAVGRERESKLRATCFFNNGSISFITTYGLKYTKRDVASSRVRSTNSRELDFRQPHTVLVSSRDRRNPLPVFTRRDRHILLW